MSEEREDTAYPFLLFVSQAETEALNEHLAERGIEVERGVELVAFTAGEQHVTCTLRHQNGSTEGDLRARYLVGCDGAHSSVRQGAGIPFEGGRYGPGVRLATRPSLTISDKRPSLSFKWASASIAASRSGAGGSHARVRRGRGGRNGGRSSELMPASVRRPA